MTLVKHHPKVVQALRDISQAIQCSSAEEMNSLFEEIAAYYGNPVVDDYGVPTTGVQVLRGGKKGGYKVIQVRTWRRYTTDGEKFSVRFKSANCYKLDWKWHETYIENS